MLITPLKTRIFKEKENLLQFIGDHINRLKDGSIVVVTSKIVALAEGRTVSLDGVEKGELIKKESQFALPGRYGWATYREGVLAMSAGIDESNVEGKYVLLPKDSFRSARIIRDYLRERYKVKKVGVIITDSRNSPLRAGAVGVAIGYAGFRGLKKYAGTPDIFGRKFKFQRVNVADSLAVAAVLTMGEGRERQPVAIIEKAPVDFCETVKKKELLIRPKDDIYLPFLSRLLKRKI
ncbi:MAG: coenzyme F420-0:L-glutamate ligase [Anaplasmataceae bacterium]|nr:coenzyme F420-0:L-glutamate ligase [Anaplasmataceae bacterium]